MREKESRRVAIFAAALSILSVLALGGLMSDDSDAASYPFDIVYEFRGGNPQSGMGGTFVTSITGESIVITIQNGTPTKSGYPFLGWSPNNSSGATLLNAGQTYTYHRGTATEGLRQYFYAIYAGDPLVDHVISFDRGTGDSGYWFKALVKDDAQFKISFTGGYPFSKS